MNVERLRRRARKGYADARRVLSRERSARDVAGSFGASRRDLSGWHRATSDRHQHYRAEHPVPDGSVAIVCVSKRPHLLDRVLANVERQGRGEADFVYVTTAPIDDETRARLSGVGDRLGRVEVVSADREMSLGAALNEGIERTDARFIAKFDDDDHYGASYLVDALRAHGYASAGVVGKATYYAHLEESNEWILRFPGHEFSYSGNLAGATFVIDRDRTGGLAFEDLSLGEDRAFVTACHRAGISTFAADRFNFYVTRNADNTWTIPRDRFVDRSIVLGGAEPTGEHAIER